MSRRSLYTGPAVTVTFQDHGQDFIEWDIDDSKVIACRPFQASIWCGREVHSIPTPGEQLRITGHDGKLSYIKYPLTKVKALKPAKPGQTSKAVLNSKVVTKGAMALLANYKEGSAA